MRRIPAVLSTLVLTACSANGPSTQEAPRPSQPVVATPEPEAEPASKPEAEPPALPPVTPELREAALSRAVLRYLEGEHLLRKKIDDDVSRAAFDYSHRKLPGADRVSLADRDLRRCH